MLLLRFPNSGIRAKVFMRKIGFKLCVIRLNHIESFYAFLLHFCSECNEERRPATARSLEGVVDHGQAPYRGGHPRPGRLQGRPLQPRPPTRGRLDAARASPQGLPLAEAAAYWRPTVGAIISLAGATTACNATPVGAINCRVPTRGCCPRPTLPVAGATTSTTLLSTNKGSRCLHRGDGGSTIRVSEVG
ncbi:hypothetical protein B296_00019726 [Ensete ventricosum]|uniref:Uncharacterized protein n=1 Tax=Ensete ventricosum TaxID=4639 RepID=A0A426XE54_ENSVE|nr:hypothetical protein B296_00019726 [Ensete ventricosum]